MKLKFSCTVLLFGSFLPAPILAVPNAIKEQDAAKPKASTNQPATAEHRLIAAVNMYRASYKLPPLEADPVLTNVAKKRAPFVDARRGASTPGYNHHACGRWCRQHAKTPASVARPPTT